MRKLLMPIALLLVACIPLAAGEQSIPGIGKVGKPVKLHGKFEFTEGPAADAKGNVYFSDIPKIRSKGDLDGKLSKFTETSNHANG